MSIYTPYLQYLLELWAFFSVRGNTRICTCVQFLLGIPLSCTVRDLPPPGRGSGAVSTCDTPSSIVTQSSISTLRPSLFALARVVLIVRPIECGVLGDVS